MNQELTACLVKYDSSAEIGVLFIPNIRWTGKELGANPIPVFMSGDLGGKQSHAFPLKTIQMH